MSELKPCPFCGEQVFTPLVSSLDDGYTRCISCGTKMQRSRWQSRPIEDALRKRVAELESAQRWRVVADGELPEDRATILAAFKNREILTATYYKHYEGFGGVDNWWDIEGWHSGNVTHWMPLPQPPEEREE